MVRYMPVTQYVPVVSYVPVMCKPPSCGFGGPPPRAYGFGKGHRTPRNMRPFAQQAPLPVRLLAGDPHGFFGAYW